MDQHKQNPNQSFLEQSTLILFSDEMLKIRRNLLILSFIAVAYKFSKTPVITFNPLGITFGNVNSIFIDKGFFVLLAYVWLHFVWYSIDAFAEWRLKLTGVWKSSRTPFGDIFSDQSELLNSSTLMNWWLSRRTVLNRYDALPAGIEKLLLEVKEKSSNLKDIGDGKVSELLLLLQALEGHVNDLRGAIQVGDAIIKSTAIPESLERFENCYKRFAWSQLLRWLVLESGLPIVLGLSALVMLFHSGWVNWVWNFV